MIKDGILKNENLKKHKKQLFVYEYLTLKCQIKSTYKMYIILLTISISTGTHTHT